MPSKQEVVALLRKLDKQTAQSLESQDLEFKGWINRSFSDSVRLIIDAAICQANGGGGTVVVGVKNDVIGRDKAISGVPHDLRVPQLRSSIHARTEPTLNVRIEELAVAEGTGRLLLIHVPKGSPPYFDTSGRGTIRIDDKCEPLSASLIAGLLAEAGNADFTGEVVEGNPDDLLSAAAIERLRSRARSLSAAPDLLQKSDIELLRDVGLVRGGRITRGGLLLLGKEEHIAAHFPGYAWTYLLMKSDTDYEDRADGRECAVLAMDRILDVLVNPIQTVRQKLIHDEFRLYPIEALREALMNAFGHADYRLNSPFQIKQFRNRLEISNPGGMIGGVKPDNILQHPSVTRNPSLMGSLIPLRLVNRAKLGVRRIYKALLAEGKEPPEIYDEDSAVRVVFRAGDLSESFCAFVSDAASRNPDLFTVEQLLVIRNISEHGVIDAGTAAHITQQRQRSAESLLAGLVKLGLLEQRGRTKLTWRLTPSAELAISGETTGATKVEAAFNRVRAELDRRKRSDSGGMSAAEMGRVTGLSREQVKYLTRRLRQEKIAKTVGSGPATKWVAK